MDALFVFDTLGFIWIFIFCAFGNGLVILSVKRFDSLKTATTYFVALLAFFDLVMGGPAFVTHSVGKALEGAAINSTEEYRFAISCRVHGFVTGYAGFGNLFSTFAITVDRYIYIHHPLRYHGVVTNKKAKVASGIVLILATLPSVISMVTSSAAVEAPCKSISIMDPKIMLYVALPLFAFTLLGICWFFVKIAIQLCKEKSVKCQVSGVVPLPDRQLKLTKVMALVIGVFLGTYMTFFASFFATRNMIGREADWIQAGSSWIWKINIWINPFIYGYMNKDFKRAFRILLRMKNSVDPFDSSNNTGNGTIHY